MSTLLKRSIFLFSFLFVLPVFAQPAQGMLLLKTWQPAQGVRGWLMSEKLDGVRAYWDGENLISRGGNIFAAPESFTRGFPPFALDGELWTKRGDFESTVSIVRRKQAHSGWKQISYQIFDVPNQAGGLPDRLKVLERYLSDQPGAYIRIIDQVPCKGQKHLQQYLNQLVSFGRGRAGGEKSGSALSERAQLGCSESETIFRCRMHDYRLQTR